jgi:hypothetical protein
MCLTTYELHACGHISEETPIYISHCLARMYQAEDEGFGVQLGCREENVRCIEEQSAKYLGSERCEGCEGEKGGGVEKKGTGVEKRSLKRNVERKVEIGLWEGVVEKGSINRKGKVGGGWKWGKREERAGEVLFERGDEEVECWLMG